MRLIRTGSFSCLVFCPTPFLCSCHLVYILSISFSTSFPTSGHIGGHSGQGKRKILLLTWTRLQTATHQLITLILTFPLDKAMWFGIIFTLTYNFNSTYLKTLLTKSFLSADHCVVYCLAQNVGTKNIGFFQRQSALVDLLAFFII